MLVFKAVALLRTPATAPQGSQCILRENPCSIILRWTGATCASPICSLACINGLCTEPDTCTCTPGFEFCISCNFGESECDSDGLARHANRPYVLLLVTMATARHPTHALALLGSRIEFHFHFATHSLQMDGLCLLDTDLLSPMRPRQLQCT